MKNTARKVAASMPPTTPVPTAWRAPAPAPLEMASGTTPRMCERGTLPVEALLAEASQCAQRDPLATVRQLAQMALTHLAGCADTQAMFDVIFHKCEFTEELAPVVAKNDADRAACLSRVQMLFDQAVAIGQLPAHTDTFLATQGLHAYMVGLMHEWVLNPGSYDLAACAEPLLDCYLSGLAVRPPVCRPPT